MGFFSKITKPFKKAAEVVTKPFAKITNKILPNELRFLAPYAAGIGSLMLGPTMSPFMRALASGGLNIAGQIAADESATGDLSDINLTSTALASGLGALGSNQMGSKASNFNEVGGPMSNPQYATKPGFFEGVGNVAGKGVDLASDYVQGTRSTLAGMGQDPSKLMSLGGAKDAMAALGPTATLATGDVAYENAIDARDAALRLDAEEQAEFDSTNKATGENRANLQMTMMRQAGIPEDTVKETLEMNDLSEYYSPPEETAAYGGMMGRNDYEFGGIIEAIKNAESREMMTQNRAMGGMMGMGNDPTYHQVRDQSGPVNLQGMMGYNMGGSVLPQGMEMDYRQGGFIPMGSKERADDVPARVSKNEFVMTADAVRAAGGGSVNQGAKKMYDLMNNLEAKA